MILLDTHAVIWLATDNPSLGRTSVAMALSARDDNQLAVSVVSFWEIALLLAKQRLDLRASTTELRADLLRTGVIELPLTGPIAILAVELDQLHNDPADRFIAATAIAHDATLVTADERLLRWQHPLLRQDAAK